MVKKFINIFFLLLFFLNYQPLFSQNAKDIKKYKILIKLCRQINDKSCQLKYYSYLYEIADENLKEKIKKDVKNIISKLSDREKRKIKLNKFKKNWVYEQIILKDKITSKKKSFIKTIGLCIPLSGEYSYIGEQIIKGILVKNPKNLKIKIFDTCSGNIKINEFKKFVKKELQIIVGPVLKKSIEQLKDILLELNIPVILLNDEYNIAKSSAHIFVHYININDEMKKLCEEIKSNQTFNLAILYPDNLLGAKYKTAFFNNCFVPVKAIGSYSSDTVDFKNILYEIGNIKKIKEDEYKPLNKIDGFLILDKVEKAILIIPQIYFYDFKNPKIYGIDLWNDEKLFKLDKKFLKNIAYVDCIDYDSLKEIYNNLVDFYSVLAYDTIKIITELSDMSDLTTKTFNLLSGNTYFDKYGISHKSMKIFKIIYGGKYVQ